MSEEIVKTVFLDAEGKVIVTPYVVRVLNVPQRMRIPLYRDGIPRSQEELQEFGITVKQMTQGDLDAELYASIYAERPQLADAVRAYAALFSGTGVEPTADSESIRSSGMDEVKMGMILAAMHDMELNYQAAGRDGLSAYYDLPKLLKYLPDTSVQEEH